MIETIKKIEKEARQFKKEYPNLKDEIQELVDWAVMEIEDGASPNNEYQGFINAVNDLIKEDSYDE